MIHTFTDTVTLEKFDCGKCAGVFALNSQFTQHARANKGGYHCPYCQASWSWHTSENDRLRQENETLKRQKLYAEESKANALREAEHFRKSRDGMKGVLVKERKRVSNGVCPCCNRTFSNLASHMATKHPQHANKEIVIEVVQP